MKTRCLHCGNENPKHGMKTCSRKCADELKKINSREKRNCLFCKNEFEVRKKDQKKLCSEECRKGWSELPENIEKRIIASKKAVKEKFGVDNVFQIDSIKERSKETKLEKYGDENYNNKEQQVITLKEKYGDDYYANLAKKRKNTTLKKYGVEHHLQIPEFLNKQKQTNLEKYGVENVSQNEEFKQKRTETMIDRFGVENASQNEEIKQKKKQTSLDNYGVTHHLKDYDMFQKHQKSQYKIKRYKETDIYYNGSYELYFLQEIEKIDKIHLITNGESFEYTWNGEVHTYHTDFLLDGTNIEIKSGWTYNKNGADSELENLNKVKWKSVTDSGKKLIVLIDKHSIDSFLINHFL